MLKYQIKTLRRREGLSQADLAHRLHISPSTIGMYEQGRRQPSIETLIALSKEFGVSIDYLVTGKRNTASEHEITIQLEKELEFNSLLKSISKKDLMMLFISNLLST